MIVSWHRICKPYDEGGLGIRSMTTFNEATNLKLGWDMLNSNEPWAPSLKSKAIRNRKPISHHIFSSIWSSVKNDYSRILENSTWLLGTGENINFWFDFWCGEPFANRLNLPENAASHLTSNVKDFIMDYNWCIPPSVQLIFPHLNQILMQATIPKVRIEDRLVWKDSSTDCLTLKEAYIHKSIPGNNIHWANKTWSPYIPPSKSLLAWRIMHDRMSTDEKLMEKGS